MMKTMQTRGVQPNVTGYNAAITACEKGHQWQLALQMMMRNSIRRAG